MVTISTSTDTFRSVEKIRVDTAPSLITDSWTEQPSLFVNRLSTVAGPDIDTAELEFNYGIYADQSIVTPLSLDKFYVRIILRDTDSEPASPTAAQMMSNAFWVWYGVIEVDERDAGGTRIILGESVPTGEQKFTAFGLLRELALAFVTDSIVKQSNGVFQRINRGIPFNSQATSQYPDRGNQTTSFGGPTGTTHIFNFEPFVDNTDNRWTAASALAYTLEYDSPKNPSGLKTYPWNIIATGGALDWFDITVQRDRRSVKDIVDDLIDRRHLVGYYVQGVEDVNGFHVDFKYFTFNETAITLDGSGTLVPNTRQFTFDFESSFDIEVALLGNNSAHRTDFVTARGAFITTTFSCFILTDYLEKGWTSADETTFKDAAKNITGYGGLDTSDKQKANQIARTQDSLNDVYTKFVIGDAWNIVSPDSIDGGGSSYYVAVEDLPSVGQVDITLEFFSGGAVVNPAKLWHKGKTFLRYIPIREQSTDDLSDYRDPFVVFRTTTGEDEDPDVWEYGHELASKSVFGDEDARQFSTRLSVLDKELGFRIQVGASGGQQLIALEDWDNAAETKEEYDPETDEGNGVDFKDMIVTGTIEWDDRIRKRIQSPVPATPFVTSLRPSREMYIDVPDARLDFLLPGTVTDIDDAGALVQSSIGDIIRDDRRRITRIAEVAAEWFGRKRQALQLRYKQLRPPTNGSDKIVIGDLITSIGAVYSDPEVNSVVTSIVFEMTDSPTTTVETSFAHLDITSVF